MSDTSMIGAMAVWGAWEAAKVFGIPKTVVDKFVFPKHDELKKDDHDVFLRHVVSCENCQEHQKKQIVLLDRIVENTSAIKIIMEVQSRK